jgi:hypothetical protein
LVWPDELGAGIKTYIKLNTLKHVNKFMCTYVRWITPDATWNKRMIKEPNRPFFCYVTPSDIAYILFLIKNGKDMWDQTKRRQENPEVRHEKRAKLLVSTGEGKRRESGKTVWNNDGLEFFHTAERNWTEVYNSKEQFSELVKGWEMWEPNDKTRKDPIRTKWRREEQDKKKKSIKEKRPWWENEEQGYASDLELNAEYDLDEITCEKVGHELGEYEEEELENHDKKGEEEEEEEAGREQKEDRSVGNDVDDEDEDDEDNQKSASKPVRKVENRCLRRQRK